MVKSTPPPPRLPRLRVAFRRVGEAGSRERDEPVVFCPRTARVRQVVECRECSHFAGLRVSTSGEAFLRCAAAEYDEQEERREELSMTVLRTDVAQIMSSPVRTVPTTESLAEVASIFLADKIGAIPVVDADGRAVGIVARGDTLERYYDDAEALSLGEIRELLAQDEPVHDASRSAPPIEPLVLDVMTRTVFSMPMNASISSVSALMAFEGVHHVVITDAQSIVVGIVSSLDLARWIANLDGYVVPKRRREH